MRITTHKLSPAKPSKLQSSVSLKQGGKGRNGKEGKRGGERQGTEDVERACRPRG